MNLYGVLAAVLLAAGVLGFGWHKYRVHTDCIAPQQELAKLQESVRASQEAAKQKAVSGRVAFKTAQRRSQAVRKQILAQTTVITPAGLTLWFATFPQ